MKVSVIHKIYDGVYPYKGYGRCTSECHLALYKDEKNRYIAVATELPYNRGTSITNRAEKIATEVCRRWGIAGNELTWIEHYPDSGWKTRQSQSSSESLKYFEKESFAVVSFDITGVGFKHPRWRHISKESINHLLQGGNPDEALK